MQIDILNSQKTPDNDWVIAPYLSTGEWGTLWIYKDQMYIFLNNVIHGINTRVNEPFHNKIYNELSIFSWVTGLMRISQFAYQLQLLVKMSKTATSHIVSL